MVWVTGKSDEAGSEMAGDELAPSAGGSIAGFAGGELERFFDPGPGATRRAPSCRYTVR